jgi:type VI secretion system protein ImpG
LRLACQGADETAYRLHEQVCGHTLGVLVLPARRPATWHETLDAESIEPAGFGDDEALLPQTLAGLAGQRVLQEYFAFPQRFLAFDVRDLGAALRSRTPAEVGAEVDLVLLFDRHDPALLQTLDAASLALHCVPAINLFERRCDRIQIGPAHDEYHVVPDRTWPADFEVHTILEVQGYGVGVDARWRFVPFYAAFRAEDSEHAAYYLLQREPRLLSMTQQREGTRSGYLGSEVYLSLVDPREAPFSEDLRQLGVRALCSNRDLPLLMPLGGAKGDLVPAQTLPVQAVRVVKGPSRPLPATGEGAAGWKLVNQLSLNHLSLTDTDPVQGAAALRELLRLHVPAGDGAAQRQVDGVRSVQLRPVVRRLPMPGPITFGRGVEVTVEVDDLAFEGASAFLFGCVLERFVARHVSLNGFTQTRVRSPARGDILVGRPRCGSRPIV